MKKVIETLEKELTKKPDDLYDCGYKSGVEFALVIVKREVAQQERAADLPVLCGEDTVGNFANYCDKCKLPKTATR